MDKHDEQTPAVRERDKRIEALEDDLARLAVCHAELMARVETIYSRVSEEVARQATELGAEIGNQFAAARRGEMQELVERVAKLEQWEDRMAEECSACILANGHTDEDEEAAADASGWPRDDGYENPGPASISPLG